MLSASDCTPATDSAPNVDSRSLRQIPPRAIEEGRLRRAATLAENLYTTLRQRYESAKDQVRNKLRAEAYRAMPRLFVLADALHHGSMQAWALGATDTISRPFDAQGILQKYGFGL